MSGPMDPERLAAVRALVQARVMLAQTPKGFAALRDLLAAHDHWQAEAGDAQVEVLLILGVAVAQVWRASYGEASFASVSVEPIEGAEGPGFVARATVGGIKLGEVARDRCAAMGRLIAATRVRGEIERRLADEAGGRRWRFVDAGSIETVTIQGTLCPEGDAPQPHVSEGES